MQHIQILNSGREPEHPCETHMNHGGKFRKDQDQDLKLVPSCELTVQTTVWQTAEI